MDNPTSNKKCTKVKMEPYHDTCYSQNVTAMCDIPFHTTANTLIYCQTGTFADATHSVKANVCAADTKYENHMDKQRYRAIRKWKRIEKGKDYSFSFHILNFQMNIYNLIYKYIKLFISSLLKEYDFSNIFRQIVQ